VERRMLHRPELPYLRLPITCTGVRWFLHRLRGVAPVTIHMPAASAPFAPSALLVRHGEEVRELMRDALQQAEAGINRCSLPLETQRGGSALLPAGDLYSTRTRSGAWRG